MGKLNVNLLKGVEDQENAIDQNKVKDTVKERKQKTDIEHAKAGKGMTDEKENIYQMNTKPQKQSFSFRAECRKIESWKLYAETVGGDMGALWSAAIDEYIENHKLTAEQQTVYELKQQVLAVQRKINSR